MTSNTQYKQTEISEIPENWQFKQASDVLEKIIDYRGKTPPKASFGVPLITAKVVKGGRIDFSNPEYISEQTWHKWMTRGLPQLGDIVMTTEAPLGEVAQLNNVKIGLAQSLLTLRGKHGVLDNAFLKYYLLSFLGQQELMSRATGSVVKGIKQSEFRKIRILLPPFAEQQLIASILSSLDDTIELNRKTNQTLEKIGKALFNELFANASDKGELQDIMDFNPKENLSKGVVARYIEMKDLPEDGMWLYSEMNKPYNGGSKFRNGDSLMARITPCLENGKSGFVNSLNEGEVAFGSTEFIVLRPKDKLYEEVVYYLVRDDEFREYAIRSMVGSSGRQRVQTDAIKQYQLQAPSINSIERFHALMQAEFQLIKSNAIENEKLSAIRDSLLPRLMSGKLRVNN